MKRIMTLIVVMGVLLFSQLASAEWEFHPGEFTVIWGNEVQDQGLPDQELAAAVFKIIPLQIYTYRTQDINKIPWPWFNLDQEFDTAVSFRIYGSGDFSSKLTITDIKTGTSKTVKMGQESITEGQYWYYYRASSFSGPTSGLPRQFKLTYSYKVGTIVKSVSTKIELY